MDRLLNSMKAEAAALGASLGQPRFGTITSVDPATCTARVNIQPESILSGWLPILTLWAGAGWGLVALPAPGDQVLIIPQEGDADHGIILGRVFSQQAPPPAGAAVGEFWLVHASGSCLKLCNDGSVQGKATSWQLQGDLHVAGDVYDRQGPLSRLRQHYDAHTHTDSRGGTTTPPTPQD